MKLPVQNNRAIVRTGDLTPDMDPSSQHFCHMYRADELRNLLQSGSFQVVALSASDSLSATHGETLAGIREEPALWNALLELELEASASSGYLEAGTHLIAVAKKVRNPNGI
jgi:hypothetical protein